MPIIYLELLPPPDVIREPFRNMYHTTRNPTDADMKVNQIYVPEHVLREGVDMDDYRGFPEVIFTTKHIEGPLPEIDPFCQLTCDQAQSIHRVFHLFCSSFTNY